MALLLDITSKYLYEIKKIYDTVKTENISKIKRQNKTLTDVVSFTDC